MPKLAQVITDRTLAAHPAAVVHQRGERHLVHRVDRPGQSPLFVADYSIGALHYHDGTGWQDIDTDWVDSALPGFADHVASAPLHAHVATDGSYRIYPRSDRPGEYVEFGPCNSWAGAAFARLVATRAPRLAQHLSWQSQNHDIHYEHQGTRLKVSITLNRQLSPRRFRWQMTLAGLTFDQWQLKDAAGEVVAEFAPFTVVGANGVQGVVTADYTNGFVNLLANCSGLTFPAVIDPTIDVQVGAQGDSGYVTGGSFYTNWYLPLGFPGGSPEVFCRFTDIAISGDANLSVAYLSLCKREDYDNNTFIEDIYCNAADTASAPTSASDYAAKDRTTAYAAWTVPTIDYTASWYDTVSTIDVLEEVFARGGWSSGNAVMFFFIPSSGADSAWFHSYYTSSANAPKLHIEYTAAATRHTLAMMGAGPA